jgi:hemerythrin
MKARIDWFEVLETGIPEIDTDHHELIADYNHLAALMEDGQPWSAVVVAARSLVERVAAHFRSEEAILKRIDFPRRSQHVEQHRRIEAELAKLVAHLETVNGALPERRAAVNSARTTLLEVLFRHDLDFKSHLQNSIGL